MKGAGNVDLISYGEDKDMFRVYFTVKSKKAASAIFETTANIMCRNADSEDVSEIVKEIRSDGESNDGYLGAEYSELYLDGELMVDAETIDF